MDGPCKGSTKKPGTIRQRAVQLQPICLRPSSLGTTARTSPAACVQGSCPGLQHEMRAAFRPLHLLTLAKAHTPNDQQEGQFKCN